MLRYPGDRLSGQVNAEIELRRWLDGLEDPLPWSSQTSITADEWFFVTTLYGEMTLEGQRTHIGSTFHACSLRLRNETFRTSSLAGRSIEV